ncbi:M20 family metallopeptidase [Salinicoccus kekensis]|uniref:Glutamate carboxypeptidase n=1 Tax=Salinicoccus kekensis TaxID=714307 RepID=A0A285URM8_9STAP|nr:M20 family metallopeptidase [Salinicoccus kekensis]SOC42891.1 glutamate carboxypeptidase [Salinicoccus kekensis]
MINSINEKYEEMIELLEKLVNIDSGSYYKKGVDEVGEILQNLYRELGYTIEVEENDELGNNILIYHPDIRDPQILIIAHMDTVFDKGTVKERPFTIEGDRAYGPGVADMKASQVSLIYAIKYLQDNEDEGFKNLKIILNSDEEIGSKVSQKLIKKTSEKVAYSIVMEPARKDGSIVTSRRGGGRYILNVKGIASHSGVAPEEGKSAIEELAHKVIKLNNLSEHKEGVSINVGLIKGGQATNMVPDTASCEVDVRVTNEEQAEEVVKKIEEIVSEPDIEGTKIELSGGINRPPMEFDKENKELFNLVTKVGKDLGIEVKNTHTGGGSDASFSSSQGVATIDGMGPIGGKLHNEGEYLDLKSFTERTLLLAETISKLSRTRK